MNHLHERQVVSLGSNNTCRYFFAILRSHARALRRRPLSFVNLLLNRVCRANLPHPRGLRKIVRNAKFRQSLIDWV